MCTTVLPCSVQHSGLKVCMYVHTYRCADEAILSPYIAPVPYLLPPLPLPLLPSSSPFPFSPLPPPPLPPLPSPCSPKYPCDMVTVVHLVLYKTADLEYLTRERAIHLLQILDKRYIRTCVCVHNDMLMGDVCAMSYQKVEITSWPLAKFPAISAICPAKESFSQILPLSTCLDRHIRNYFYFTTSPL